ncbi:MAG: M48 family metalloprotease [Pseudomonadota bacterium]
MVLSTLAKRARSWALGLALVVAVAGCAPTVNPATGTVERTRLTPVDEARLGATEHPRIVEQFGGVYTEPRANAYVTDVGNRVKAVSELANAPFLFTILNSPVPNAFALPGGYVYVTRGLLAYVNDEAELAGVLAHEIGHITARHAAQRYDRAVASQTAATLATILGTVLLGDAGTTIGQQLGAVSEASVQSFSRQQEFEADILGIRYMTRVGYDPMAVASFLQSLSAKDRLERQLAGRNPDGSDFSMFSSHPRTADRVRAAAEEAVAAGSAEPGRRDPEPLFQVVDGLPYGDDPREGFVREGAFVHPVLQFRFPLPDQVGINNRPEAVYGGTPSGLVMVFDSVDVAPGTDLVAAARSSLGAGLVLDQGEPRRLPSGLEAALAFDDVAIDARAGTAVVALVRADADRVYRFVFLKPGPLGADERDIITAMVDGFSLLSPTEAAAYPGQRLRIVTVRPGDDVESLGRQMAVETLPVETFRVLNGLTDDATLRPGQQVKLVVAG